MSKDKKEEKRSVIFRKIGGRIVPIAVGAGAIVAGKELGKAKYHDKAMVFAHKKKSKSIFNEFPQWKDSEPIIENNFTKNMKKRFGPALKKADVEEVVSMHPALAPWEQRTSLLKMTDSTRKSQLILTRSPSRLSFLHELGHAEGFAQNTLPKRIRKATEKLKEFDEAKHFNFPKILKWSHPDTIKRKFLISKPVQKLIAEGGQTVRAIGHVGTAIEETAAWIRGAKHLKTPKRKLAMAKAAIRPLSSYVAFPARQFGKLGLFAGGVAAIGYGVLKKDNK